MHLYRMLPSGQVLQRSLKQPRSCGLPTNCTYGRHKSRRPSSICSSTGSSSSSSGDSSSATPPQQQDPVAERQQPPRASTQRSSQQAAEPTKEELEQELKKAIAAEDYKTAAKLKDQIFQIEMQDPLIGLKWALEEAIEEERYADAALIRDQIRDIEEANKPQPPDMQGLTTTSDTVTQGIRVKVRSYYVPAQSRPELGQYFFAYAVSVSNESQKVVMLESRHWVITDGSGKIDHVRGPGVVGEQPILKPGKSFEYQSACPLFTTFGTMEGEYKMAILDDQGEWLDEVEVLIGRFALIKPETA